MVFFKGPDVTVDIHCEDLTNGITVGSDRRAAVAAPGATVPKRDGTQAKLADVIGIEINPIKEKEEITLFGQNLKEHIFTRRMCEVTLTKKQTNLDWAAIYNQANGGVLSGALNTSDELLATNSGFRINIQIKAGEMFYVVKGAIMTDYKVVPVAAKINEEVVSFKSNIWTMSSARDTSSLTDADL